MRRRDEYSSLKKGLRRRVRKSRQKEAGGAADAGLMQIEWSEGGCRDGFADHVIEVLTAAAPPSAPTQETVGRNARGRVGS